MPPSRPYDSALRHRRQAELKSRIAASAATLHARKGALGTSYADIAAEAGVSLPTVYAHFPTQRDLLDGCTAHVGSRAPPMPAEEILAASDLNTAAERLVDAIEQQHLHFEPWSTWRENRVIPFLAERSGRERDQLSGLIAKVLKPHLGPGAHREIVAGWEAVLSFDFWHRLARGHRLSRAAVRRTMLRSLLALAEPHVPPDTKLTSRRTR